MELNWLCTPTSIQGMPMHVGFSVIVSTRSLHLHPGHAVTPTSVQGMLVHVRPVIQASSEPPPLPTAVQEHALRPIA